MNVNLKIWEPVTHKEQIKKGSILKIVGISRKDSYNRISVKEVLRMENGAGKKWIEILINRRKNYYFNLDAYLEDTPMYGKWVHDLYIRK